VKKVEEYAASLNKLAKVYEQMGRYASAETLFINALSIRKKLYGEKNEDYATSLNNLALLYENMGEYDKAETLLLKAMVIRKEKTGG
jgi:tetratricopeptide (TPR) repeat protein